MDLQKGQAVLITADHGTAILAVVDCTHWSHDHALLLTLTNPQTPILAPLSALMDAATLRPITTLAAPFIDTGRCSACGTHTDQTANCCYGSFAGCPTCGHSNCPHQGAPNAH